MVGEFTILLSMVERNYPKMKMEGGKNGVFHAPCYIDGKIKDVNTMQEPSTTYKSLQCNIVYPTVTINCTH